MKKLARTATISASIAVFGGGIISAVPSERFVPAAHAAWAPPKISHPADVYWGGYSNNDQLVRDGAEWDYVKKYADGFHFHTAYWGNDTASLDIGYKLAWALGPYKPQFTSEGGFPHPALPADGSIGNIGSLTGQLDANMKQIIDSWGFQVNEVITNYNLYSAKMFKNAYPEYNSQDLLTEMTGDRNTYPDTAAHNDYWVDYFKEIVKAEPGIRYSHFNSPVYLSWYNYPAVSNMFLTFRDVNVTGEQLIQSAFRAANDVLGKKMTAFASDVPYSYYMTYNQAPKVLAYEAWLRENGYLHSLTINSDSVGSLPADQQDEQYYRDSMAYIKQYQADGGRADRYLLESWYPWPNKLVPETTPYTYTNLVKDFIKYIKGIKEDGSLEKLDLTIKTEADSSYAGAGVYQSEPGASQYRLTKTDTSAVTYKVMLKNEGDTEAMPNLRALENGDRGWKVVYKDGETDITEAIRSSDGYTITDRLVPGAAKTLTVEVTPDGAKNGKKQAFDIVAFWNPQDPTGSVRDVVSAQTARDKSFKGQLKSAASRTTAAGLIPVPAPTPQGLYEAEQGVLTGGAAVGNDYAGYTGSGFVTFDTTAAGSSVSFKVDGGKGGNKQLLIHYANAQSDPGTLSLYVNGKKVKQLTFSPGETADWSNWSVLPVKTLLKPGNNTIKLQSDAGDSGGINIDDLVVLDSSTYEAEDADLTGVTAVDRVRNASKGGYVQGWNAVGDTFKIPVRGGSGGSQPLVIRYANGDASSKTVSLYVNGTKIKQLSLAPTEGWSSWASISETVNLIAGDGKNAIELRRDNGDTGGIQIDNFTVDGFRYEAESVGLYNRSFLQGTMNGPATLGGTGYVKGWVKNGDNAEFTVSAAKAGNKTLSLRFKNESTTEKTVSLYVNGKKLKQLSIPARATTWAPWQLLNEPIKLSAGVSTIKIQKDPGDTGNVLMDSILVNDGVASLSKDYIPNEKIASDSVYEAEYAVLNGVSTAVGSEEDDAEYYTGLGYVSGWDNVGDSAAFTVDGGNGGPKRLKVYYQNRSDSDSKTISLYVNGTKKGQLTLAPGDIDSSIGFWTGKGMSIAYADVNLEAGSNAIELRVDSGDTGRFERLDKIALADPVE